VQQPCAAIPPVSAAILPSPAVYERLACQAFAGAMRLRGPAAPCYRAALDGHLSLREGKRC